MLTLFNPTNEVFNMTFAGMDFTMKSGEKHQMDDSGANHLLNSYGRRGLCQLVYGDDEKTVAAAGRQRNEDFKKEQVANYNIMNEQRKMGGLGYLKPTPMVQKYALELGIGLLEPYTLKDVEKSEISNLMQENADLKRRMDELMSMVVKMVEGNLPQTGAVNVPIGEGSGGPSKIRGEER